MIQLVAPNLSTAGRLGFCLEYARKCFGLPAVEPSAWEAWRAAQFKHADHNIPSDVAVPCWFSYVLNGVNLGHVVISVPGQGFYSSPWKLGTDHAVLPSIAEVERIYGVVYVGWSEDISKTQVVKENDMDPAILKDFENWKDYGVKCQSALATSPDKAITDNLGNGDQMHAAILDLIAWKTQGLQLQKELDQTANPTQLAPGVYKVV